MEFENFLHETFNDKRYSYCVLKCKSSMPQRKATQIKDNRIPRNMGWNWKATHTEVKTAFMFIFHLQYEN